MIRAVMLLLALAALSPCAIAHEIRPGFLQIHEVEPHTYDVLWKTPAQGDMRLALNVVLPPTCADASAPRSTLVEGAVIRRWRTHCEGGLVGRVLAIENLGQTLTDTIVSFEPLSAAPQTMRLTADAPSITIPDRQAWTAIAANYFGLGVQHILEGVDHLLFVLGLMLLVADLRRLFAAVTAFTVAHSLTLAGTTLGLVRLPAAPVEAMIAFSIMAVAAEGLKARAGGVSLTARLPWLASFAFGLLHGFGFASALRDVGLPEEGVAPALLFFNVGVEAGQLIFISTVLAATYAARRLAPRMAASPLPTRLATYVIGIAGGVWFVERAAVVLTG